MKGNVLKKIYLALIGALFLMIPALSPAQTMPSSTGPPAIEQHLIRQGELAVKLVSALGVGVAESEAEAETRLAEVGITPKSGWIADYPVTPDIAGELRAAVSVAADAGRLPMDRYRALSEFDGVMAGLGLPFAPYGGETAYESPPPTAESYQTPAVINNYYYNEGPPVVTYYPPPPAYTYLYSWVPYPFWTAGFLFPGFFILHDFHRTVVVHKKTFFVTNHFRDARTHRVFRVDPVKRFKGHSFFVKRGHDSRAFIIDRHRRGEGKFVDRHQSRSLHDGRTFRHRTDDRRAIGRPSRGGPGDTRQRIERSRTVTPSSPGVRSFNRSSSGSGRDTRQHFDRTRTFTPATQGVRNFNRSSSGSGRDARRHFDRTRTFSPSSQGVRNFSRPSSGSGRDVPRHFDRSRSVNPSSQGARSFSRPSGGSGRDIRHFRSGGSSGSQGSRSFSRPSSRGGSSSIQRGGARSFSPSSRGGGFSHGGRGRR